MKFSVVRQFPSFPLTPCRSRWSDIPLGVGLQFNEDRGTDATSGHVHAAACPPAPCLCWLLLRTKPGTLMPYCPPRAGSRALEHTPRFRSEAAVLTPVPVRTAGSCSRGIYPAPSSHHPAVAFQSQGLLLRIEPRGQSCCVSVPVGITPDGLWYL